VRGTDAGIWSRIHLIPFVVHLPSALGDRLDRHFADKLGAEQSGILNWLIAGCLKWQQDGLKPPADVLSATDEYRREMDVVDRFVSERCVETAGAKMPAGSLYKAYRTWSDDVGEWRMSKAAFTDRLKARRGVTHHRSNTGAYWIGIMLADSDDA